MGEEEDDGDGGEEEGDEEDEGRTTVEGDELGKGMSDFGDDWR
jgi:hypothetical protein